MRFSKYVIWLILLLLPFLSETNAQTPYFIHHKVLKGKRGYRSQVIYQDHLGFIWFGTTDGLILYDGTDYIRYSVENGMAGTSVTAMCEDSTDSFWIGHENGKITRMKGSDIYPFLPEEGLGDVSITDIEADSMDRIWFSTLGEGIYYYEAGRLYNLNTDDGLADDYAYSLECIGDKIFVGTDYGISIYDSQAKSFEHVSMSDGIPDNIVKKIVYDAGKLWVGTDEAGVFSFDLETREIQTFSDWRFGTVSDFVKGGNSLWISTERSGVIHMLLDEEGMHSYTHIMKQHGLMSDRTSSIFLDREKNLWIGTRDEVTQSVTSIFEFLDQRHGLPENMMVYDFLIDENDFYWICSNQGFFRITENNVGGYSVEKLFLGTRFENANFISLFEDIHSYIWAGTYDYGVFRIDPATLGYRQFTIKDGLCDNNVGSITADHDRILFSTYGGGISSCRTDISGVRFRNLTSEHPEIAKYVYRTMIDSEDRIWIAQDDNRLSYLKDDSIYSFGEEDGLQISAVYSLLEDTRHNIWFSSAGDGLYCYDGQNFINYSEDDGLSSSNVRGIETDLYGNLVVTSNEGIDIFNPENSKIYSFGDNYGVSYLDPQLNSIYRQNNGEIWIGTRNGLVKYKPQELFRDTIDPLVFLLDISLLSEKIEPGKTRFFHNQNHFTFNYNALWYQDPDRLRFRSMLEGYDLEWSSPTSTRDRTYSKLPPGDYTFLVEASLDQATWISSPISRYSFTIRPPFWQTWWFILSCIFIILLSILAIFRIRLAQLRKQKEELQIEVAKATEEIREQNAILESQKSEIQAQRDLVMDQRDQIVRQQEELQSSIRYAHRIQTSVRTPMSTIEHLIPDYFILDKPRDIVSGDFFWVAEKDQYVFISVADCTGHGVPGAFMSMLGNSGFNQVLSTRECGKNSGDFLNLLRDYVKNALHHIGEDSDAMDGLDVALIILDKDTMKISFSGANNPLYLIRDGELIEYKPDKMPIGWHTRDSDSFHENRIEGRKGDSIYLFSDGYADQFGGANGKKFMYRQFKTLLLEIHEKPMQEQLSILENRLEDWKGDDEQIDDIMVMGVRL